ncbi:hypothetical protein PENTCL1PPCAC_6848, partial [Pristionchus entomophagus]
PPPPPTPLMAEDLPSSARSSPPENRIARECITELFASLLLSFFIVYGSQPNSNQHISSSFMEGLIVFTLTSLFTHSDDSPVQLNPAVSISVSAKNLGGILTCLARLLGQFIGSLLGFLLAFALTSPSLLSDSLNFPPPSPFDRFSTRTQMFFLESIFTSVICLPYLSHSVHPHLIASTRTFASFFLFKGIGISCNFFLQLNSCIIILISSPSTLTGLPFIFLSLFSSLLGSLISLLVSHLFPL